MKHLAICGKMVDVSKFAEKSKAQFRDQLRRNGVELDDAAFEMLYEHMDRQVKREAERASKTEEEK